MSNSTFPTCNALPSSQTEMDGERNLQRNIFNGSKLRRTASLQYVFSSFQNQQRNLLRRSQSNPDFSDKNTRVYDDNINYGVGLFTLSIYEEFSSKQKEDKEAQNEKVYEAKGVFTQTPKPDHKLDKHPTTYKPGGDVPDICKCLLESQSQTDNRKTTSERLVKHKSKMAEDPVIINEELVEEVLEKWPVQNIAKFGKNLTSSYYLEFQEYPNTSETGFANIYNVSGWNEDEA
ncbi:13991_t:CDS:2 [Rhizophagus irregularis]|nr:13991_t:CDS:2 [Rhizophagus irregularis]